MRFSVQVRCGDVVQGVVLERGRSRVDLGGELEGVGRAVAGGGAYGADPFGWRFQGRGGTLMETVFFTSDEKKPETRMRQTK